MSSVLGMESVAMAMFLAVVAAMAAEEPATLDLKEYEDELLGGSGSRVVSWTRTGCRDARS